MINDEEHTVSIDMLGPVTLKYMISVLMPHWKRYQYRNKDIDVVQAVHCEKQISVVRCADSDKRPFTRLMNIK